MADALSRRPNGNALHRAQAGSLPPRARANFQLRTPICRCSSRGTWTPEAMTDVGLTLIRKSDPARPQARPEGRGGAGGRRDLGRRLQGGRAQGPERLPGRPQDHGPRHLRGPLGRLDPGGVARQRHHAGRDDQGAARHQQPPRPAAADRLLQPESLGVHLAARQARSTTCAPTSRASVATSRRASRACRPRSGPPRASSLREPTYTHLEVLAMRLFEHISPKREVPALIEPRAERLLRQRQPRALAAPQPGAPPAAERFPRLRAQAAGQALHHRVRPRHRRARRLRRRRELRGHDLAGGAGVERAADLLQAGAHQRRRLRRRRRAPHREHRHRHREGRRPDHLLQPVPPVPEPDRRRGGRAPPTSPTAATSRIAGSASCSTRSSARCCTRGSSSASSATSRTTASRATSCCSSRASARRTSSR